MDPIDEFKAIHENPIVGQNTFFKFEIDVSKMKGIFELVGVPKQIGLVPNKLFNAP